jgi:hypothetical protein
MNKTGKKAVKRADMVLWLSEVLQNSRLKLRKYQQAYVDREIAQHTLINAQHKMEMVKLMLNIFQDADMEPQELLDMLQREKFNRKNKQSKMNFKNPV